MDRIFLSFAAIMASGIFSFSYIKEWIKYAVLDKGLILKPSERITYPYYHESESLYLTVMLAFAIYFTILCLLSIYFTFRQKQKKLFLCFVLAMLGILGIMVNGAIKV